MKIIDSNNEKWDVLLQNINQLSSIKKINLNDEEFILPETEFSIRKNTIKISQGGQIIIANVAKNKDTWWVHINGKILTFTSADSRKAGNKITQGSLQAPMPGTILDVHVSVGQTIEEGQSLLVMEAMKMEHKITAPFSGTVEKINCNKDQKVDRGFVLIELKQN
tara:strand:+ start:2715 stop:3209 length:495 start_codon:yes stop_codon:yes gene_type:complete